MGRSGFDDRASQSVKCNIEAEGCKMSLIKGDVTVREDVERAFASAALPMAGIVQGAMVVRVRRSVIITCVRANICRENFTRQ